MYKRKPKTSTEKLKKPANMTVAREKNTPSLAVATTARKSPWPSDTGDNSWDGSRATTSSWPEDVEEAATTKILDLWNNVERFLYKEDKDDEQLVQGSLMEECIQWRTQIPHFRVVGGRMNIQVVDEDGEPVSEEMVRRIQERSEEPAKKKTSGLSKRNRQIKEAIIQRLVDYIVEKLEDTEIAESHELDDVLRITPAPTYSGRKSSKHLESHSTISKNSSANKHKSFQLTERITSKRSALKLPTRNAKYPDDDVDDDDVSSVDTNQLGRNKLGTVFNEKIVVSPVPYAVTTRESFCTLKTTPIKYAGHLLELTTPKGFSRNVSSSSKINSAKRSTLLKAPQRHSAWQAPVCPSVWPKNVRLEPIDPSRLPSSKNRSVAPLSTSVVRHKNSLSPILRPLKVTSADNLNGESLEIQGKQITQSAKPNLTKNGWDNSRTQRRKKS